MQHISQEVLCSTELLGAVRHEFRRAPTRQGITTVRGRVGSLEPDAQHQADVRRIPGQSEVCLHVGRSQHRRVHQPNIQEGRTDSQTDAGAKQGEAVHQCGGVGN